MNKPYIDLQPANTFANQNGYLSQDSNSISNRNRHKKEVRANYLKKKKE